MRVFLKSLIKKPVVSETPAGTIYGNSKVTHLTSDHPEFAAISAQVTPLNLVHKEAFPKKIAMYAEQSSNSHRHLGRHESVSKFRG